MFGVYPWETQRNESNRNWGKDAPAQRNIPLTKTEALGPKQASPSRSSQSLLFTPSLS